MGERPIDLLNAICEEIFQRWDKDQRSGKLLSALSGRLAVYRPDVTEVRRVLESHDALVKALAEIASLNITPDTGASTAMHMRREALAKAATS